MRLKKILLILPLLLIFAAVGCDSDNNSNAAAPPPGAEDSTCPCFTADDIRDDVVGRSFLGCETAPSTLAVELNLAEGNDEFVLSVDCPGAVFGDCQCLDAVRNVSSNSVTEEQYFECVDILVDAIINEFGESSCLISN